MLHSFLSFLHRGGAVAYYHVLPQRRSLWFDVDDIAPIDPANAKTNLYFGVHPCSSIPQANAHGEVTPPEYVRSQKPFIAAVNCLYAEFDVKDYGSKDAILAQLKDTTTPSVVIDSGGGIHAYWLLDEPYIIDTEARHGAIEHVQNVWPAIVGADTTVHDLCRVLRVPGSWNYKYQPRREVTWLRYELDRLYTLQSLAEHIPPVVKAAPRIRWASKSTHSITAYNTATDIASLLQDYGYAWHGSMQRRMISPWSDSKRDGVIVKDNRCFVHTGSDPLCDGYWKKPFDVRRVLDYKGDFKQACAALHEGRL